MMKLFGDDKVQIRTGFHRTKNLKDLLVPSSLPDKVQEIVLTVTISVVIDAIDGYVMLVKTSWSLRNVLKVLSHVIVIKSDSLCHAALTM